MKKKLTQRKRGKPQTWLITALLAAGAVAYVVFIFLPLQRSIRGVRAQVQERRQQIMQAHSLVSTVSQARIRLASANEVSQQWKTTAPRPSQLITHLASITSEAQAADVAIDRLDPVPLLELKTLAEQNVVLQFHSPFPAVFDFVKRLESLPGTLWIRDLRLHANSEGDSSLRGDLTLTIFVDRAD
jgi:Tfp pilus assembly protein PilO